MLTEGEKNPILGYSQVQISYCLMHRYTIKKLVQQEMEKIGEASKKELELIELHRAELEILRSREERAKSLAQQTRAGYVYVISNPMSFGENIVKIVIGGCSHRLTRFRPSLYK